MSNHNEKVDELSVQLHAKLDCLLDRLRQSEHEPTPDEVLRLMRSLGQHAAGEWAAIVV